MKTELYIANNDTSILTLAACLPQTSAWLSLHQAGIATDPFFLYFFYSFTFCFLSFSVVNQVEVDLYI